MSVGGDSEGSVVSVGGDSEGSAVSVGVDSVRFRNPQKSAYSLQLNMQPSCSVNDPAESVWSQ